MPHKAGDHDVHRRKLWQFGSRDPLRRQAEWKRYLEAGLEKWNGLSEFLNAIDAIPPAVNLGMLVGHGDLGAHGIS